MFATLNLAAPSMVPLESVAPRSTVLFRSSLTTRNEHCASTTRCNYDRCAVTELKP